MAHKDRKTQKRRGSRTHGYGSAQKHRGAGSRGGRGMAGSKKHKWSFVSKYMPGYFGKKGFKRPITQKANTINVGELDSNLEKWAEKGMVEKKTREYSVSLNALGYEKLLGSGKILKKVSVTVKNCSKKAREKIEKAGGAINLLKDESGVPETGH